MKNRRPPAPATAPVDPWLAQGKLKTYRRGQRIIEAGSSQDEWIAISRGAAYLVSQVAPGTRVAVAALWLGDVIGGASPLGKLAARYDVTALVDVTTIHLPLAPLPPDAALLPAEMLALPISQACIGQLSGLSRRQAWIYLGQLGRIGWVTTARSKVTLEGLSAWLALMAEVEASGIECIATLAQCDATLLRLTARKLGVMP